MTDPLTQLADNYGADKSPNIKHHYTPVYYELFKDRRFGSELGYVENMLEIGVAEGASLYMWREFFPEATIYGADNDFYRVFKAERIQVFKCDQGKIEDLENLMKHLPSLDLVIDDGSHDPQHQLDTCLKLMSMLNTDVIYVIEDVDDQCVNQIIKGLQRYDVKEYHVGKRHDDRLIVVRHK